MGENPCCPIWYTLSDFSVKISLLLSTLIGRCKEEELEHYLTIYYSNPGGPSDSATLEPYILITFWTKRINTA